MVREKRQTEPDEAAGAPEWMVTFSDCMTLLLTFFVLLLSFSSFDDRIFGRLKVIYSDAFNRISLFPYSERDSFLAQIQLRYMEELDRGSEKPTLEQGSKDGLREETEAQEYQHQRVFLVPSKKIFWGKGTVISSQGQEILVTMASFLKNVPGQVMISENGQGNDESSGDPGLLRAWAVAECLTTRQGLDKKRISISVTGHLAQESLETDRSDLTGSAAERFLEIVLLERSVYN